MDCSPKLFPTVKSRWRFKAERKGGEVDGGEKSGDQEGSTE